MTTFRYAALAVGSALLAACVTQPVPLQGDYLAMTPRDAAVAQQTGSVVRWGGRIVQTLPRDNNSCFEVLANTIFLL
jgi:outer membrane lipoprotein